MLQRILISPAGGQVIHGIVSYFKNKGFTVIGIDSDPESIGKVCVDRFLEVPSVDNSLYMGKVLQLIAEHKVDIFISWLNPEIIFWNGRFYASEIPSDLINIFAFNFRKDLINFCDKFIFYTLIGSNGFDCPEMSLLGNNVNVRNIGFPAIIKPRIGYGTKNTYIIENEEAFRYFGSFLSAKYGDTEKFIIQEFLEGTEYTIDFFSINGKVINAVIRKRIKHKGVSLIGEIVYHKAMEEFINSFCSVFGIDGLNNIQIIESKGRLYILDFNPRPSGTIVFSINAGVDLINNLLEKMEGKEITVYGKPKKLKMVRYLCEFFYE